MGNACVASEDVSWDGLCTTRDVPVFVAPNNEHITYAFDHLKGKKKILLAKGATASLALDGFLIESQKSEKHSPKVYVVKEYSPSASQLRTYVSGRILVNYVDRGGSPPEGFCAFAFCTRGRPIFETLRTRSFTHTAQVTTSGVVFAFKLSPSPQGLYLVPCIQIVTEQGAEVVLVDDRLGPLSNMFFADFAIADDGGRNVQLDLILRCGAGSVGTGKEMGLTKTGVRTFRTCLQDYTAFNNYVNSPQLAMGFCNLGMPVASTPRSSSPSTVHLQNLVVSEERFDESVPEPRPFDVWKEAEKEPEDDFPGKVLFEGLDARAISSAHDAAAQASSAGKAGKADKGKADKDGGQHPAALLHPQLRSASRMQAQQGSNTQAEQPVTGPTWGGASTEDFWYNIRYSDGPPGDDLSEAGQYPCMPSIDGEFWLSKQAVDKKDVYFNCSSTLAQALTMCIAFRFSCPTDFITLIEARASNVLKHTHIPTNGVVMGVEADPRHGSLLRMFIEHRNEILDDMIVCECCRVTDQAGILINQEVFDLGSSIQYRLTLIHTDGSRQSAVLTANAELFDDAHLFGETAGRSGSQYQLVEEPSPRFPISPCLVRHDISPANRIFVYSSISSPNESELAAAALEGTTSYNESCTEDDTPVQVRVGESAFSDGHSEHETEGTCMTPGVEDWQSAAGAVSDLGDEGMLMASLCPDGFQKGAGNENDVSWRSPLIESVVLLNRVENPPFKCFPQSLST
eukprot:gnl/TRDRNA2_/TRDRNA2_125868_c0_seq1.p1 gnl/TRDRNA2_/TRDRNA2_125868_c0~~gnl/TRDRNA2_/TRDRNA2_125868_c0_seq1.p1  ORF type:complete len:741 (-),score=128.83 gnl/TRDRNA2_/TRDRNA2_125868_c0_seq1:103-2325(-)